ncbi:MAG: F0F1 ATP synthase subunit A [Betaproteobacteria bacterium]|nr:F0F1 ATP synthase subunit A [Betaproteobacteria bacterium]
MSTPGSLLPSAQWHLGPLTLTGTELTSLGIVLGLSVVSGLSTRRLKLEPGAWQVALEGIVSLIEQAIRAVLPDHVGEVMPLVASLWIYILVANLLGIIPGLHSPTSDLSLTAGLAMLVFVSVHWYGLRIQGLRGYLRHYLSPTPLMLPFHVLSELTRTLALAVRLFGNIMSLEMTAMIVLLVAGFLVPVPVLMLHIVEAVVQAYIFGMLALIYIAGGIQSQERLENPEERSLS